MAKILPARLIPRFLALMIGFIVIIAIGLVLLVVNMTIYAVIGGVAQFNEWQQNLLGLTIVIPTVIYCIITENSRFSATLGKRKMKIKVVDLRGQRPNFKQIIIRNLIKFVPWQLAHMAIFHAFAVSWELDSLTTVALIIAGYILPGLWLGFVIFRKDHRGIHDLAAGTMVVSVSSQK